MKSLKNNYAVHFLILGVGVAILAYFFNFFKYHTQAQIIISVVGCIFYVVWGIIHHATRGRLTRLIALEYMLVGFLIFLLLLTSLSI